MTRDLTSEGPVPGQERIDVEPCDRGMCAAPQGHPGTCAQASGWDDREDKSW